MDIKKLNLNNQYLPLQLCSFYTEQTCFDIAHTCKIDHERGNCDLESQRDATRMYCKKSCGVCEEGSGK